MKTNEVMIGDYVLVKPSKMPIKIVAIHRKKVAYHTCADKLTWVGEDLLAPIILIPEILKKNGFHEEMDEDIKLMICDNIIIDTGINYKLYKDGKMYLHRVLVPLYYVHQLQHALKICGITREIII